MKKIIAMLLACLMVVGLFAGCASGTPANNTTAGNDTTAGSKDDTTEGTKEPEKVTLTVWGPQEDQVDANSFLQVACAKFNEAHPEWDIEFKFGVCPEGDAGKNVTADPSAAADVYAFANDQLGTLIQANGIAKLGGAALEQVKADNSEHTVSTVSDADGNVYGVPFAFNTWFMYYDTSVYTEEDIKSLDTMLEKGRVAFPLTNSWYIASFYVANGGTLFGDGTDGTAGIQFGGDNGVAVTKYLVDMVANPNFVNDADGAGMDGLRNGTISAMFSGTWDAKNAAEALGENFGAAQLPCITIDGQQKQLRSFAGSKAYAANPNSKHMAAAIALAAYVGSSEMQALHYEIRKGDVVPCALSLLASDEFSSNLAAVAQEATFSNTSILQPSIPEMNAYWTPAEAMGKAIVNGEVTLDNAAEKTDAFNASINETGL